MEVSYIELIFENCEVVKIEPQYIGKFALSDVTTDIKRIGCNYIGKQLYAKNVLLELFDDATYLVTNYKDYWDLEGENLFNRIIKFNDITCIDVFYEDGSHESIYVPWKDSLSSDETNAYMTTIKTPNDSLIIYIGDNNISYALKNFFMNETRGEYMIRRDVIKHLLEEPECTE